MFQLYKEDQELFQARPGASGKAIEIQGFMAPHLKVASDFFILSNTPVETCPFCASEGDWIDSIVFVRMKSRARQSVQAGSSTPSVAWKSGRKTDAERASSVVSGSSTLPSGLHDRER